MQVIQVNENTRKLILDNSQSLTDWENQNPLLPRGKKPPEKVAITQVLSRGKWLSIE